jgi:hypothetical protein
LTVTSLSGLTGGNLSASVTVNSGSSSAVQVATVTPVVTPSMGSLPINATSLTINGFGFDPTAANDTVMFSGGVTGTMTTATATQLTVTGLKGLTVGNLSASVTVDNVSSGSPVQVATVTALTPAELAVQELYLAALGRPGSLAELDGWANQLPAGATSLSASVASGIEGSFEARDDLVKTWYQKYLGRPASGGEEQGFVILLQAGQTEEQALSLLLGSQEFFNRAQTLVTSGTPQQRFVQSLYQLLLKRTGGADEVAGWVNGLAGGLSQQQVALGFLQSQEYHRDQFTSYYPGLLGRPASTDPASGDQVFIDYLVSSGTDLHSGRLLFEGSAEFFAKG